MGARGSAIVCVAIAILCVIVLLEEPPEPTGTELAVRRGEESFRRQAMCITCHALGGQGGRNGPSLDHVATEFTRLKGDRERAGLFFHEQLVGPASDRLTWRGMRRYCGLCLSYRTLLLDGEIWDITEYLMTLE